MQDSCKENDVVLTFVPTPSINGIFLIIGETISAINILIKMRRRGTKGFEDYLVTHFMKTW